MVSKKYSVTAQYWLNAGPSFDDVTSMKCQVRILFPKSIQT